MFNPRQLKRPRKHPSTALDRLREFDESAERSQHRFQQQAHDMHAQFQQVAAIEHENADALLTALCRRQQTLRDILARTMVMYEKEMDELITDLDTSVKHLAAVAANAATKHARTSTIVNMLDAMHQVAAPDDPFIKTMALIAPHSPTLVFEPIDAKVSVIEGLPSSFVPGMPVECIVYPRVANGAPAIHVRKTDIVLEFQRPDSSSLIKDVSYNVFDGGHAADVYQWRVQFTVHDGARTQAIRLIARVQGVVIGEPQLIRAAFSGQTGGGQMLACFRLLRLSSRSAAIAANRDGTRLAVATGDWDNNVLIYSLRAPDAAAAVAAAVDMTLLYRLLYLEMTPSYRRVPLQCPTHVYFTDDDQLLITDSRKKCVFYATQQGNFLCTIPFPKGPTCTTGHGDLFATAHSGGISCFVIRNNIPTFTWTWKASSYRASHILFVNATTLWAKQAEASQRQMDQFDVSLPPSSPTQLSIQDCAPFAMTYDACVMTLTGDWKIRVWTTDGSLVEDAPLSLRSCADDNMTQASAIAIAGAHAYVLAVHQTDYSLLRSGHIDAAYIYVFGTADGASMSPPPLIDVPIRNYEI